MSKLTEHKFILYETDDNNVIANVLIKDEKLWATQKEKAHFFNVDVSTINDH